jgi:hypothetical protein
MGAARLIAGAINTAARIVFGIGKRNDARRLTSFTFDSGGRTDYTCGQTLVRKLKPPHTGISPMKQRLDKIARAIR